MPTFSKTGRFERDCKKLSIAQIEALQQAAHAMVEDMASGPPFQFRNGLRIKGVQGRDGVFEMTWAPDGRATFEYGPEVKPGEPHIIWRRAGTHSIFNSP